MPAPISLATRLRPKPDVLVRELGGEAVLLDVASGRYFGLNATGVRIWALLGEGEDLGQVIHHLASEYGTAPVEIGEDLLDLCSALEREGLVDRLE